jgi:CheY-like chemotaxis protein
MRAGMVKILMLEDNAIDAFIAQKVIMLSGAEVVLEIAHGAAQGLSLLINQYLETRELPDFILVDQFMPLMNGLEFLDAFASLDIPGKDKITILMLTSSIDPHLTAETMKRGAHGIITKPMSIPVLTEMITQKTDPVFHKRGWVVLAASLHDI